MKLKYSCDAYIANSAFADSDAYTRLLHIMCFLIVMCLHIYRSYRCSAADISMFLVILTIMSRIAGHATTHTKSWTIGHEEEYVTEHAQKITNNYTIHSTTQTVYRTN